MPELPEVETVLRGLKDRALGRRITAVIVGHPGVVIGSPEDFATRLEGKVIAGLRRKGKALALELGVLDGEPPLYLLMRLGMTGQVTVAPVNAPLESHTHVRMALDVGGEEVRFRDVRRFGRLRCCTLVRRNLDLSFITRMALCAPNIIKNSCMSIRVKEN